MHLALKFVLAIVKCHTNLSVISLFFFNHEMRFLNLIIIFFDLFLNKKDLSKYMYLVTNLFEHDLMNTSEIFLTVKKDLLTSRTALSVNAPLLYILSRNATC